MAPKTDRVAQYSKEVAALKADMAIRSKGLDQAALNAVQATHANGTETCCQVIARLSGL
jgi:hypothetical protein